MKWICVDGTHINTNRVDSFYWRDGKLWVCFADVPDPAHWDDPDRALYIKMCHDLGVRPREEDDEGGKE